MRNVRVSLLRCNSDPNPNASPNAHPNRKVLACIRKSEARLSDRCRAKATAIERIAHRELAYNAEAHPEP